MNQADRLTVKDWDDTDKPRERLIAQGKKQLSNVELIAILLRSGMRGKSVVELSREVLAAAGNSLTNLSRFDYSQLSNIKGMAEAKATTLMAALELGWRMQGEIDAEQKTIIAKSSDTFNYLFPCIVDLDHEEFWAVFTNSHNRVLARQRISSGGQTETSVDLRMLFRAALENKATSMVVAHNHPSGSLQPSKEDLNLTKQIQQAARLLGIRLLDHLIIAIRDNGKADYFSFCDEGLL